MADTSEAVSDHSSDPAKPEVEKAEGKLHHALVDLKEAEQEVAGAEATLEEIQHHHFIHFTVDGEPYETERREWTPDEIITKFAEKDPSTNYLVQIEGNHKKSFQGEGNNTFELHEGARFQVISTGPTPVSDGRTTNSVGLFFAGLQALGYEPLLVPGTLDHLVFDYVVETGSYAGQRVRIGLAVPSDFPLTPPGGPHVSPRVRPFNSEGTHPTGKIHDSSQAFERGLQGQWQYWSRPFPNWIRAKKTVAAYMSHVWQLWDSQ